MAHQVTVLDRYERVQAVLGGEGPDACPILEDLHREALEAAEETYEFTVPAGHPDAAVLAPEGYVFFKDLDGVGHLLRIKQVEDELDDQDRRVRRVLAEQAALELNWAIVRPATWQGATASQALQNALANTRWQVGEVEWAGVRTIKVEDYRTVTQVLHQIAGEFGGELRYRVEWSGGKVTARYVDLLQRRGQATGVRFEYSQDIKGLRRVEDTTELATALVGLGASDENGNRVTFAGVAWSKANGDPADKPAGQDWVGDPEALQRWGLDGRHLFGVYEDPDEEDPAALLQKTWNELQARVQSRYTYEVDVALLERLTGYEHKRVRLGDTITVHDTSVEPPLVVEARVIELERSYVDPTRDRVVLGHYRPVMTTLPGVISELRRRLISQEGVWNAKQDPVHQGPTPSADPQDGDLWLDTSATPHVLYRYDATAGQWKKATPTEPAEVKAEKQVFKGTTAPPSPQVGDLWLDTSATPNILKRWDGTAWVKAAPTTPTEVGAEKAITKSNTAPSNPAVGDLWLDTSTTPNVLKRWTGSAWVKATPTTASEVGAERAITKGNTAPSNPQVGDLWLDTSTTPHAWKRWNGSQWVKATPTTASEVGAETPAGAQAKADQAEQNAKNAVASGQVSIPTSALQGAIDAARNAIQATAGWVFLDANGLIVYDNQDPEQATKAVKIGAGGILLANSKTEGNWNWRTAITGDGIAGDQIVARTITADKLNVSQLSAITANLGTVTAGTLTGVTIQTGTSGARIRLQGNVLESLNGNTRVGVTIQPYTEGSFTSYRVSLYDSAGTERAYLSYENVQQWASFRNAQITGEFSGVALFPSGAISVHAGPSTLFLIGTTVHIAKRTQPGGATTVAVFDTDGSSHPRIEIGNAYIKSLINAEEVQIRNADDTGDATLRAGTVWATQSLRIPSISNPGASSPRSTYPLGLSWHVVSGDSSWPGSYGHVITFNLSSTRGTQFFFSNGSPPVVYVRVVGTNDNWTAWQALHT